MPRAATRRRAGRFDYATITARVESAREAKGMSTKALGEKTGIPGYAWYRKMQGERSTFTLDELGAIADVLDAPEGWPFVEWTKGDKP